MPRKAKPLRSPAAAPGGLAVLRDRAGALVRAEPGGSAVSCGKASLPGSVSQRACVFCGSRVVLYPIADAVHLVHGPMGCAAYTWDIRGSLSSGPELHRISFSTDLREEDVIFGGEPKLKRALGRLIEEYSPAAAFVYATCIAGLIGDDLGAVCAAASREYGIPVIPVRSEGFKGSKNDGYRAACEALRNLIGTVSGLPAERPGSKRPEGEGALGKINILGEFNLAGETELIRSYYEEMGLRIVAVLTGDGRVEEVRAAHLADFNVVQCAGSMTSLAKDMKEDYGIPFARVSYFGLEDCAEALYAVARAFPDKPLLMERARAIVSREVALAMPELKRLSRGLEGKKAAIYVGGAFKAHSLVKALRHLGMRTVLVGSQTGNKEEYDALQALCDPGTVIADDSNPVELSFLILSEGADLFIGGVKERPMAYKLGLAFCDHNHERKIALAGFEGMVNFAREIRASVLSPVWRLGPRRGGPAP
jgi:nitrogenase molybdenum-cofactor synthesis protein NifE